MPPPAPKPVLTGYFFTKSTRPELPLAETADLTLPLFVGRLFPLAETAPPPNALATPHIVANNFLKSRFLLLINITPLLQFSRSKIKTEFSIANKK